MEVARIGSAFGAAMDASRQSARLRAAERYVGRQCSLWRQATRKECARRSWRQRLDASVDLIFACAACVMLVWLLHRWA
jgi:hypothetical protein